MSTENNDTRQEPSLAELVQSMESQLCRNASTDADSSNKSTPSYSPLRVNLRRKDNVANLAHRNRFSKSMGDLTDLRKQHFHRSSVILEDGFLEEHAEVVVRARKRFRELELKYPEIFKNSARSSSLSSLQSDEEKWTRCNQPEPHSKSTETEHQGDQSLFLGQNAIDDKDKRKEKKNSVPTNGTNNLGSRVENFRYHRRAPPLSMATRSQNLDDSCDSAFDEHDTSTVCHETSPPARSPNSSKYRRFLYPGDSLESDKDSGISSDRPFIPTARNRRNSRPVRWADSEECSSNYSCGDLSKSTSLSNLPRGNSLNHDDQNESPACSRTKNSSYRRGILKSVAYRNQELRHGSLDFENDRTSTASTECYYRRQAFMEAKGSRPHSLGVIRNHPHYFSSEDTESDADTVYSVQSEIIRRPKSAREKYLSLYQLNASGSQDSNRYINERVYKSHSMPELAFPPTTYSDNFATFSGDSLSSLDKKQYKKKNKFNRRSGLYVVNDNPVSEKPHLISNSSKKALKFSKKKQNQKSLHITEHTKTWYDNCTAVSKPTAGKSLGKVLGVSHDFGGMAYQVELNRPGNGLYGFFIQKGYKQYRHGVFVSRIMDSTSAKFLAGLLTPGDEILEINGFHTQTKAVSEVHDIMAHSDKLTLTVLPFLARKDW